MRVSDQGWREDARAVAKGPPSWTMNNPERRPGDRPGEHKRALPGMSVGAPRAGHGVRGPRTCGWLRASKVLETATE